MQLLPVRKRRADPRRGGTHILRRGGALKPDQGVKGVDVFTVEGRKTLSTVHVYKGNVNPRPGPDTLLGPGTKELRYKLSLWKDGPHSTECRGYLVWKSTTSVSTLVLWGHGTKEHLMYF